MEEENLLDIYEKEQLAAFIQKHMKPGKEITRYLIEVIPGGLAVDVKISTIDGGQHSLETSNSTSLIDWKNYDF